jgi:hypothetical protein
MFKIVYLPTAEDVHLHENRLYSKEELERYMGSEYYFYNDHGFMRPCRIGSGMLRDRMNAGMVISKHLLEVIEVPNV